MDEIDCKILSAMEKDARVSLKNLAGEIGIKTSTIYHRLHKLREKNILDHFTVVINPEVFGLTQNYIFQVRVKQMGAGELDYMFQEGLGKFLSEKYESILFTTISEDNILYLICTFRTEEDFKGFREALRTNPYIVDVQTTEIKKLLKGSRLFKFIPPKAEDEDAREAFNDVLDVDTSMKVTETDFEFQF